MLSIYWLLSAFTVALAAPSRRVAPFANPLQKRNTTAAPNDVTVDLGYSIYEGVVNDSTGLNTWKGIRYAAPPVGQLRWQVPQVPETNRSNVIPATEYGSACPQSAPHGTVIGNTSTFASEDCLFINVWAPQNASNLPVAVWIHGGGYGEGSGMSDMTTLINTNGNSFVGVTIQYRLGAFGFLSSDEVHRRGVPNAGLLDQNFALHWVQAYIQQFGGDPDNVTIMGLSAGAGSVFLHSVSYGGTLGNSLFRQHISFSTFVEPIYEYSGMQPSQAYYSFAYHAGCWNTWGLGNTTQSIFDCLTSQPSEVLQKADIAVSMSGNYGNWQWLPVIDGTFVEERPSVQLLQQRVNGERAWASNAAEEGTYFGDSSVITEDDLIAWIKAWLPNFSNNDISKLLTYYPSTNASTDPSNPDFATLGNTGPTALNQSDTATGQTQRSYNILAELVFVCPSYWLAEAYGGGGNRAAWKSQFSVAPALHSSDMPTMFGEPVPNQSPELQTAYMQMVGSFVTTGTPSVSQALATGSNSTSDVMFDWPQYQAYAPNMLIVNQTGGVPTYPTTRVGGGAYDLIFNATSYTEPGLKNNFSVVDGNTWEGGRASRCDFWRMMGPITPQ